MENVQNELETKLYFWQGRDSNNAGWLTFAFSLKKKFKDVELIKMNQQQECPQFLAHFKRKFIIHKGKRKQTKEANINCTKMYQLRKNPHSALCTRCIQLDRARAEFLCSEFCYIIVTDYDNINSETDSTNGIIYVWKGHKSNENEGQLIEEIAELINIVIQVKN